MEPCPKITQEPIWEESGWTSLEPPYQRCATIDWVQTTSRQQMRLVYIQDQILLIYRRRHIHGAITQVHCQSDKIDRKCSVRN